uniref:Uncharacterized protein n=1 Tax=Hemiselmis tepida TaxID=464990 RepID=A0A7S0VQS9_9CRYP|mmetsp:Transcript_24661/g.62429  ORF Transcript_24661/g.62429 Transcript_24661/m.62429 type:complete len:246 (+) Transcript_24661:26-763(+)
MSLSIALRTLLSACVWSAAAASAPAGTGGSTWSPSFALVDERSTLGSGATLGLRGGAEVAQPGHGIERTPSMCPMKRANSFGELTTDLYQEVVQDLWRACKRGDDRTALSCIKQGAWANHLQGSTALQLGPLHLAAAEGHSDLIAKLVARGADVNIINRHGFTPLHLAAQKGHTKAVHALVRLGADWGAQDRLGDTAEDKADLAGHGEISTFLEQVRLVDSHSLQGVNNGFRHLQHPVARGSRLQ